MSNNYTIYIAAYGALLSTLVFLWNIQNGRANFEVDLLLGVNDDDGKVENGVFVFVKNPSRHRVHIEAIELVYNYRHASMWEKISHCTKYRRLDRFAGWVHYSLNLFNIETGTPVIIDPGNSHRVFLADHILVEAFEGKGVEKFVASAQDALWREKYSRPLSYSL